MDLFERARAGIRTSEADPDIADFVAAKDRGTYLRNRFNMPCQTWKQRRRVLEELLDAPVDDGTRVFPYFRCDLSRNIHLGRHVTINFNRVFMDFTDVTIRNATMIDPRSVLATLGHMFPPEERRL